MKGIASTVSSKGRVTIPAQIRKYLNIKEGDKLSFVIEDEGNVRVEVGHNSSIASLRGAAGSLNTQRSWKEMLQIGREGYAKDETS